MYGNPLVVGGGALAAGALPYTGFPIAMAVMVGLALVIAGLLLMRARRVNPHAGTHR